MEYTPPRRTNTAHLHATPDPYNPTPEDFVFSRMTQEDKVKALKYCKTIYERFRPFVAFFANPKLPSASGLNMLQLTLDMKLLITKFSYSIYYGFEPATSIGDIINGLTKYRPIVIALSAHGTMKDGQQAIVLENDRGRADPASIMTVPVFVEKIRIFNERVALVMLMMCHSSNLAQQISLHLDVGCIGWKTVVEDNAARRFTEGCFHALDQKFNLETIDLKNIVMNEEDITDVYSGGLTEFSKDYTIGNPFPALGPPNHTVQGVPCLYIQGADRTPF